MPIISEEELRKNVKIRYNTDMQQLEASIKVTVSTRLWHHDVGGREEIRVENKLIQELRESLRNLGGVE